VRIALIEGKLRAVEEAMMSQKRIDFGSTESNGISKIELLKGLED
jgi:hypothetical protein